MAIPQVIEVTLSLPPKKAVNELYILSELRKLKELKNFEINSFRIVRKSIDARRKPVKVNLGILVSNQEEIAPIFKEREYRPVKEDSKQVVIIGAGPGGLFAGLRAIELGLKPVILERGKDVDSRRLDIAKISREGKVNPESNYCYGEGGAGAFSDGKLYTRSKKRGNIRQVLEILNQFGASEDILINSHPHIGSDKLPTVIKNIRNKIIECGGEVRFETKMDDLIIENGKVTGVSTDSGEKIYGPVFLATGHSSRDVYRLLDKKGVSLEAKGLAIGVRLEHPQSLIDKMQYHSEEGRCEYLPAAEYAFVDQVDNRGVYTFCMCPGGVIVPAVSDDGQIVVNGMSASARSGKWANSGYVVELHPGDIEGFESEGNLEMMALQEALERKFYEDSKGSLAAPAQKIGDFLADKVSRNLPPTSYAPGVYPGDFSKLFPKEISERLKQGLKSIGKRNPRFSSNEGMMIGLESRTSSPIRIPRDESMQHVSIKNLYPVGEGAGYAGGIVSSAMDGINSMYAYYKSITTDGSHS